MSHPGSRTPLILALLVATMVGAVTQAANLVLLKEVTICASCHTIHLNSYNKHEVLAQKDHCYLCHMREGFSVKEQEQSCTVCEF